MPNYIYKVRTTQGNVLSGSIEAKDQKIAVDKLRSQNMIILAIEKKRQNIFTKLNFGKGKLKIKHKDIVTFSRQISTLINAGVPIAQGLTILSEQIVSVDFKKVIDSVKRDVESGLSIADSFARYPTVFTELYVSMVRAGEAGGVLDVIMERLSGYLEASSRLRSKVKGALVYPLIVSLIAGLVVVVMFVWIIPAFQTAFKSFGADLPLPTQILISISEFIRNVFFFLVIGAIAAVFAFFRVLKTEAGRRKFDEFSLKTPVFGDLLRKVAIAKFTRTLGTLIKSGVPILEALDTTSKTAGNKIVEEAIIMARGSIREGEKIAVPLKASGVFPPMVIQMITVGEETGALDTMLSKIADFYDEEVNVAVAAMSAMIEPVIIVVMGVVIGVIVISMYLPIFKMGEVITG